ncbi:hypothetical protein Halha_1072 [Halobacteroides halobius DSM 5150]|uniref:DUF5320 domain-containing protein n=1 Tax=Halobacteroides halobius (strain ATCC 35273 / DSM 5150 / MD-1) TaxID=748449 RepID=L0K906_HALHC|nr:DUF5320 domain-containing protein [Halobacteroides halobius]AGB41030.1 hypothetical protein Halha_1072 [Halobacteroides halobius DSM 5150]
MPRGDNKLFRRKTCYSKKVRANNNRRWATNKLHYQHESAEKDGTGPEGLGPRTGRAAGYCAGFDQPGYANDVASCMRLGRRGAGRGRRNAPRRFYNSNATAQSTNQEAAKENEINYLKQEKEMLKEELEDIKNQLSKLENTEE